MNHGGAGPRMRVWGAPLVALVALAIAVFFVVSARPKVVFEQDGTFGPVRVVERPDGLRELYIGEGRARQSAVYPRYPDRLELAYSRVTMIGPALVSPEARVLFVGLGGGVMPTFLHRRLPGARIDVVEIDPVVAEAARRWFGFREDPNLALHVDDGRAFVEAAGADRWDLVVLDAFSDADIPRALTTREFLDAVRTSLAPSGVVVSNLHTAVEEFDAMVATYQSVFPQVGWVAVPGRLQVVLVAGATLPDREGLVERARRFAEAVGLDFDLGALVAEGYRRPPSSDVGILTDEGGTGGL